MTEREREREAGFFLSLFSDIFSEKKKKKTFFWGFLFLPPSPLLASPLLSCHSLNYSKSLIDEFGVSPTHPHACFPNAQVSLPSLPPIQDIQKWAFGADFLLDFCHCRWPSKPNHPQPLLFSFSVLLWPHLYSFHAPS